MMNRLSPASGQVTKSLRKFYRLTVIFLITWDTHCSSSIFVKYSLPSDNIFSLLFIFTPSFISRISVQKSSYFLCIYLLIQFILSALKKLSSSMQFKPPRFVGVYIHSSDIQWFLPPQIKVFINSWLFLSWLSVGERTDAT